VPGATSSLVGLVDFSVARECTPFRIIHTATLHSSSTPTKVNSGTVVHLGDSAVTSPTTIRDSGSWG